MRDYMVFYAALETNPGGFADFPQWFMCMTQQQADDTASGMTPIVGGTITTAKFALRLHTRADVYAVAANLNTLIKDPSQHLNAPQISFDFDGKKGASEYRALGTNSRTETKAGAKGSLLTASISNPQALLDALARLPTFAAQLTKVGRLRDAGIVLYAYRQVIAGAMSITGAFAYLRDAGVL